MVAKKLVKGMFIYLLALAMYDSAIKIFKKLNIDDYSVNLAVFYFVVIYSFALYILLVSFKSLKGKLDRLVIIAFSLPFIMRIALYLCAINKTWAEYLNLTSNIYIDSVTWGSVILFLILLRCLKNSILQ